MIANSDEYVNSLVDSNARYLTKITDETEMKEWLRAMLYGAIGYTRALVRQEESAKTKTKQIIETEKLKSRLREIEENMDDATYMPISETKTNLIIRKDGRVFLWGREWLHGNFAPVLEGTITQSLFIPSLGKTFESLTKAEEWRFRDATEDERKQFVSGWVKQLWEPISTNNGWTVSTYAYVIYHLITEGFLERKFLDTYRTVNVTSNDVVDYFKQFLMCYLDTDEKA